MKLSLIIPPLTQLNTPYPAMAYLARHLRNHDIPCTQRDLGLELILKVLSKDGLGAGFDAIEQLGDTHGLPEPAWHALASRNRHESIIEPIVGFLQGRDPSLAKRILIPSFLPSGPRLDRADLTLFGTMGIDDAAKYRASLYIEDVIDLFANTIDPGLSIAHYQHHLAHSCVSFDPIYNQLQQTTIVDQWLDSLTDSIDADVVGVTVPFPGTLYGALRIGHRLKSRGITVWMGGGYVNTELRDVAEPRLWDCVDALTYDDGEGPLLALIEHHQGGDDRRHRTRTRDGIVDNTQPRPVFIPAAWYGDFALDNYLQVIDTLNPTHRMWSDNRWNKITLAHGCYWKRCAFCDINLDYISHFEQTDTSKLVDTMAELIQDTKTTGFHFVDEAAPPKLMRALALELLKRKMTVSWWGNIRFEKTFTPDLCRLLAAAGLVGVTGGLEVASDRLLKAMDKGITVEQAIESAAAFQSANVMVHAYLMYGFPTQTHQDSVDAMETVRQMFESGLLSSAFWHRFVLTRHSAVYSNPKPHNIQIPTQSLSAFASNDIPHIELDGADHDVFDEVLAHSLAAWMRGQQLNRPAHKWFSQDMPHPSIPLDHVSKSIPAHTPAIKDAHRLIWLGNTPLESEGKIVIGDGDDRTHVCGTTDEIQWVFEVIEAAAPNASELLMADAKSAFPGDWDDFQAQWSLIRNAGLVGV